MGAGVPKRRGQSRAIQPAMLRPGELILLTIRQQGQGGS
jgi:hypothetical protein